MPFSNVRAYFGLVATVVASCAFGGEPVQAERAILRLHTVATSALEALSRLDSQGLGIDPQTSVGCRRSGRSPSIDILVAVNLADSWLSLPLAGEGLEAVSPVAPLVSDKLSPDGCELS